MKCAEAVGRGVGPSVWKLLGMGLALLAAGAAGWAQSSPAGSGQAAGSSGAPAAAAPAVPGGAGGPPQSSQQGSATTGVLGVLGAPKPAPPGSVPANAPIISVSVNGSSVKSGQTVTVPPTPVANTSEAITVEISNTGGSTLKLDKYAPPELYGDGSMMYMIDYTNYSRTIDPGESTTIAVTFFPYQTGADDATLVIISNDPRTPQFEIKLAGKGLPMATAGDASSQIYGPGSP